MPLPGTRARKLVPGAGGCESRSQETPSSSKDFSRPPSVQETCPKPALVPHRAVHQDGGMG